MEMGKTVLLLVCFSASCYARNFRPLPCTPNPCGPYSECRAGKTSSGDDLTICRCLPDYPGLPPTCHECKKSADCAYNKVCIRNRCLDPCIGTCGISANCKVFNHIPMCSCPEKLTGNPFVMCNEIEETNNEVPPTE